ncbi:DegV family protein [Serpentinicella alkaliphila]|uniref:DegV family protein with EDD domain n=1 Tax=Serpentinicella alkaliphila TaxID=1734049 RepID=A0A4R2T5L2_9FIRM|nr:DegV family protein [Serpentinicella alkaliphila]QUH25590.1 DegV family protein [Serpentinicella alkaliphila]TCP98369.1 DegV family protein with EDD domain [Serpentinicella alkaliphila]
MSFKIVADSSCDLTKELKEKMDVGLVPLTIEVDNKTFVDNQDINVKTLIQAMKDSKLGFKTACPSPADFMNEYEKADNVFVVTLSSALSGTYNSAMMAKEMMLENVSDKFIHVFDSLSASVAETLVSIKIHELIEANHDKFEIVNKVENYIKEMKTFFILDSLDNLIKTGRINKIVGQVATALNIKPIMGADDDGSIKLVEKIRGSKKAFKRLAEIIGEQGSKLEDKIIAISHCNALEKAEALKLDIQQRYNFKKIIIVEMAGLSTAYANDGGIIVAF